MNKKYFQKIAIYKNNKFIQNGILAIYDRYVGIFFNKIMDIDEEINEPSYMNITYNIIKNWGKYVYIFDEISFYIDLNSEIKYFNTKTCAHLDDGLSIYTINENFEEIIL